MPQDSRAPIGRVGLVVGAGDRTLDLAHGRVFRLLPAAPPFRTRVVLWLDHAPAGGETWARYTFLGTAPRAAWRLNDGVIEGLTVPGERAFSVQYHPEAGPGPHDARYLFALFQDLMVGG